MASMAMPLLEPQARKFSAAMWTKDTKTTSRDGLGEQRSSRFLGQPALVRAMVLSEMLRGKHIRDSNRSADAVRGVVERPVVEDPIRNSIQRVKTLPANS